jgi:hypothetical protein
MTAAGHRQHHGAATTDPEHGHRVRRRRRPHHHGARQPRPRRRPRQADTVAQVTEPISPSPGDPNTFYIAERGGRLRPQTGRRHQPVLDSR